MEKRVRREVVNDCKRGADVQFRGVQSACQ